MAADLLDYLPRAVESCSDSACSSSGIVGPAGCSAVLDLVPRLREELSADAVVANAENSAPTGRWYSPREQLLPAPRS